MNIFPVDSDERKEYPVFSGFVQYFPSAMAAVAHHSFLGNQKHNPGQPLNWDRAKSGDEPDAELRHLMEADYVGNAWRAMALLQKHLEANGAPIAPAARNAVGDPACYSPPFEGNPDDCAFSSPLAGSRVATPAELADLRLQACGIGDVERRHPMAAEADRIAEDRL